MQYISYYKYVSNKKDELNIINFQDLINKPESILDRISGFLGLSEKIDINKVNNSIDTYRGATDILGSSKPNATKEKYKNKIKDYIVGFSEYSKLEELKKKLIVAQNV